MSSFARIFLGTVSAAISNVALAAVRERLRRMVRHVESLAFDALFGVDTRGVIRPEQMGISLADAVGYEGTSPLGFIRLLRRLNLDTDSFTFVDLGCGKGRTLILAACSRFRRIVGVELSPELLSAAERNFASFTARRPDRATPLQLVEADAATYTFRVDEPTLLYMYNPFGRQTMRSVARNIDAAVQKNSEPFYVMYYIPRFPEELDRLSSLRCIYRDGRRAIYASVDRRISNP